MNDRRTPSPDLPAPDPTLQAAAADSLDLAIARLRQRAWLIHGGTAALAFLAAALVVVGLAALALGLGAGGWVRPLALLLLAGMAIAAASYAIRKAARPSAVELARQLEARDPEAAGLTTAVELAVILGTGVAASASARTLDGPAGQSEEEGAAPPAESPDTVVAPEVAGGPPFSEELAWAHISVAAGKAIWVGPERAFPLEPLKRAGAAAGIACALLLTGLVALSPLSVGLGLLALGSDEPAAPPPRATPITGDITLTYLYPRYTGLAPRTIEGTNGEIAALRGTQVRIETRADREVARAFLDIDGAATPLEVEGGRRLSGSLQIQGDGSYSFRFEDARGRTIAVGPKIPIAALSDGVPTVSIDAPVPELVLTERDSVDIVFEAADDFGIGGVELVYQIAGGEERNLSIASYGEPRPRAGGSHHWELSTMDARPGDVITYYLRARDNDAISGPKWGQSRTQQIKIFSEAEHRRALIARVQESWEKMIVALGERIWPRMGPRKVEDARRLEAGKPADQKVMEVVTELTDVAAELGEDERAPQELLAAIRNISQELGKKNRLTRDRRARGALLSAQAKLGFVPQLDRVEEAEQRELEQGILYLEAMLDRQRLAEIEELARELAADRRQLANLLEAYQEAPTEEAKAEIRQELSRLKQRMAEMMRRMAELGKGLQDEHLNAEAMQALAQERDMLSQLDEVERLLAEGKTDEALAELQKLGMKMDEMARALSDAADGQTQNDPTLRQIAEDMEEYERQLDELLRDQEQLVEATQSLRQEQNQALRERLSREGDGLLEELRRKIAQARDHLGRIPDGQISLRAVDELGGTLERLDDLENALLAKDFDAAQESAARALAHGESLRMGLQFDAERARRYAPAEGQRLEGMLAEARPAVGLIREVKERLDDLFSTPGQQMSEQQRARSQRLAQRQGELGERMQQLQEQAEKVGAQAPIFDEEARQRMAGAQQSMEEAEGQLRGQDTGGALAAERRASEQLRSLKQSLDDARERAQQGGGGSGFPMPLASGGGRGRSGGRGSFDGKEKVAIPDADQYKAPEEYRKEILDAMKQRTPEGFEENVRDYYQEIVK